MKKVLDLTIGKACIIISSIFFLQLILFRDLLLNFSTNLVDGLDYPYYSWVIDHFVSFVTEPSLFTFFTTNSFYQANLSYFFSDLLIPQSLFALIPYLLGTSIITATNIVFFGTLLLNTVASFFLWKKISPKLDVVFFGCFVTALSPFVLLQFRHLQMITLWPLLFFISMLLSKIGANRKSLLLAILWTIQLSASIYLGVFTGVVFGLFYLSKLVNKEKDFKQVVKLVIQTSILVAIFSSPLLYGYYQVQQQHPSARNINELSHYAAHLSDYLFVPTQSLLASFTTSWQNLNQHTYGELASYPSTPLLVFSFLGLFSLRVIHIKENKITFNIKQTDLFFLLLACVGFAFSLGPRLFINGTNMQIPLLYRGLVALFPPLMIIRATARWSLLLFLALTYFAVIFLAKIASSKKRVAIISLAIGLFSVELLPLQIETVDVSNYKKQAAELSQFCQNKQILLYLPVERLDDEATVSNNLSYKTNQLLTSTEHNCTLINGYSGIVPDSLRQLREETESSFTKLEKGATITESELFSIIESTNADQLIITTEFLPASASAAVSSFLEERYTSIDEDTGFNVLKHQPDRTYLIDLNRQTILDTLE